MIAALLYPKFLASFLRILFPELQYKIVNKRLLSCAKELTAECVIMKSSVAKHYCCKCTRHCGLIANGRSQVNQNFSCVRNMNCCFCSLHSLCAAKFMLPRECFLFLSQDWKPVERKLFGTETIIDDSWWITIWLHFAWKQEYRNTSNKRPPPPPPIKRPLQVLF